MALNATPDLIKNVDNRLFKAFSFVTNCKLPFEPQVVVLIAIIFFIDVFIVVENALRFLASFFSNSFIKPASFVVWRCFLCRWSHTLDELLELHNAACQSFGVLFAFEVISVRHSMHRCVFLPLRQLSLLPFFEHYTRDKILSLLLHNVFQWKIFRLFDPFLHWNVKLLHLFFLHLASHSRSQCWKKENERQNGNGKQWTA